MKSISAMVIFFTLSIASQSQGVFTNDVNSALQKVIQDYPNHFVNLKGKQLSGNTGSVQFYSTVEVPGATNCVLTRYKAIGREAYTWQCVILETGSYENAKARFNELYNQIKNTIVKMDGEKPFILNGKYESPADDRKSTSIIFQLLPATGTMQRLKVELLLLQIRNEWKITLAVYEDDGKGEQHRDLTGRD